MTKREIEFINLLIIYILVIFGALFCVLPFIWLVRSALMDISQIFIMPPEWIPQPFRWQNFPEALTSIPFGQYFINTIIIVLFVEAGVLLTAPMAAFAFSHLKWKRRNTWFMILLTSLMLPYAVTLIPTFLLWKGLGLVDTYFPLIIPSWFGGGMFNIFLLRQFFSTIPLELDESAYIDGATPWQVLWKIIAPLSKPVLITVGIFTFMSTWNDLLGPIIYLNSPEKYTLAVGLSTFVGMYSGQWNYLMAASLVVMLPILVLFFFAQRYFIEGITLTGLKG